MTGTVEVTVPEGAAPAASCPHCGRPFPTLRLRDLHVGEAHPDLLATDEAAAFEAAIKDEADELFILHLKVIAALVLITMGFSYTYAFVWS